MKDIINLIILLSLLIGAIVLIYKVISALFSKYIVSENYKGLLYKDGRFVKTLEPGLHWITPMWHTVTQVDMRPRVIHLPGQEVICLDNAGLKLSLTGRMQVTDAYKATHGEMDFYSSLYMVLQLALREISGSMNLDDLLSKRNTIGAALMEKCAPKVKEMGLELLEIDIRDIMLPGELKQAYSQVLRARKEGEAALEKARGETAALRNLANAAKMMDDNPALMQLRALHAMSESKGGTVVLGLSDLSKKG